MQTAKHLSDFIGESACLAELLGIAKTQPLGDDKLGL
jgi:hypothetical protein